MLKNWISSLATALILLTASGCSRFEIEIKDQTLYGDKGKFGATAVHTINKKIPPLAIPKAEWDVKRIGMVCGDATVISDYLTMIDKFCAEKPKYCKYEDVRTAKAALQRARAVAKLNREKSFFIDERAALSRFDWREFDPRGFEIAHSIRTEGEVFEDEAFDASALEPEPLELPEQR